MPRIIKYFVLPVIVIVFFAAGLLLGAYYHSELAVVWMNVNPLTTPEIQPLPAPIDPTITSTINLPTLTDPLPLIYTDTLDEATIQQQLKLGAVVLPLGKSFGDAGNVVVTAHSSGTESFGPYRFAFAQLSELAVGSEYSINTPTAEYHYRVYAKEIVWPHEVDKLPQDERSTVTLVTCWPLWTNFQRLLVHSELTGVDYRL